MKPNVISTAINVNSVNNIPQHNLYLAEIGEEVKYDKKLSFQKNTEFHIKKFQHSLEDVLIIDKKGDCYSPEVDQLPPENNRLFIFFKDFKKNDHLNFLNQIIENNMSNIASCYTPSFIYNLNKYDYLKECGSLTCSDPELLSKIEDNLEFSKEQFRKLKVNIRVGEKLKDNLNNQSKAISIILNNLSGLTE